MRVLGSGVRGHLVLLRWLLLRPPPPPLLVLPGRRDSDGAGETTDRPRPSSRVLVAGERSAEPLGLLLAEEEEEAEDLLLRGAIRG